MVALVVDVEYFVIWFHEGLEINSTELELELYMYL